MNHDYETRQILRKEPIYRKLYSSLLQEHRGILQQAPPTKDENSTTTITTQQQHHYDDTHHQQQHNQFEDEDQILNTIFQTEMKNILVGVGASVAAVASLRFVRSSYASSTVFGSVKAKAMQEAEREGKKRGTDTFQKNFCTQTITTLYYIIYIVMLLITVLSRSFFRISQSILNIMSTFLFFLLIPELIIYHT